MYVLHCAMYVLHCAMYVLHCVMCEMRSVLEGHVYMKPTASCGAAQLWVYAYTTTHVPRRGTYRVRCEMRYDMYEMHCVMCEMRSVMYEMRCVMCELRSVLEGHVYMKPTASCGAAQLWVRTNFPSYPIVPRRGTYGYSSGRKYWSIGNPHCMYIFFSSSLKLNLVWWAF